MRIYSNFKDATNEIKRDLAEMGIGIHPKTYQNKDVHDDPQFDTKELQNYMYSVTQPNPEDLALPNRLWAAEEFRERLSEEPINPGEAYKLRPEVWEQFLVNGFFDYTYPERLTPLLPIGMGKSFISQIVEAIRTLKNDPDSRQCYISIWTPADILSTGGNRRIPCTLGYQFQIRNGALNITYLQRSSDFATHFQNDVWMATMLQHYMATKLSVPVGIYTHWIGSLHIFSKDVKEVF